jgi:hypothetical protein
MQHGAVGGAGRCASCPYGDPLQRRIWLQKSAVKTAQSRDHPKFIQHTSIRRNAVSVRNISTVRATSLNDLFISATAEGDDRAQ